MDIRKELPIASSTRRIVIVVAIAASAITASLAWLHVHPAVPAIERSKIWVDVVQAGTFLHDIRANGTLVPKDIRWLAAGTAGSVTTVTVQPGARVKTGDVIVVLSNPSMPSALAKAKAVLAAATADATVAEVNAHNRRLDLVTALAQATSDYETTKMQHESLQAAFNGGAASEVSLKENSLKLGAQASLLHVQKQRLDEFNAALSSQYDAAIAHRDEAKISLDLADRDIQNLTIVSPVDGTVQQVTAETGQQILAGANVAKVATEGNMVARLQVPEADAKDLVIGLSVDLSVADDRVEGKVGRIDPAVLNGSVAVDVLYDESKVKKARPDLSVIGSIVIATIPNTLTVSRPAGAMANSKSSLLVIAKGERVARKREVFFGAASTQRIQILSGLRAGDEVILSDLGELEQQQMLEIK